MGRAEKLVKEARTHCRYLAARLESKNELYDRLERHGINRSWVEKFQRGVFTKRGVTTGMLDRLLNALARVEKDLQ